MSSQITLGLGVFQAFVAGYRMDVHVVHRLAWFDYQLVIRVHDVPYVQMAKPAEDVVFTYQLPYECTALDVDDLFMQKIKEVAEYIKHRHFNPFKAVT